MKIQILSDIHLEANPCDIPVAGDVAVLAGDIHMGTRGIVWAAEHFSDIPVLYVAGNHEYYGNIFPDLLNELRAAAAGTNVQFLENDVFIKDGVRFLGATLWTDFALNSSVHQDVNMAAAKHGINDFRGRIKKSTGELLRPTDVAEVHGQSLAWLQAKLTQPYDGITAVITHHAPCTLSAHPYNRFDSLTPAFVTNLEGLIRVAQPALWISGHTHFCADYRIENTRMISNQRGYSDEDDTGGFKPDFVVDL